MRTRRSEKGLARRGLQEELRRHGIADDVAAAALEEIDPADEERTARDLVGRRLARSSSAPLEAQERRLTGMLGRKGYPAGLARRVVLEALASARDAEQDDDGDVHDV